MPTLACTGKWSLHNHQFPTTESVFAFTAVLTRGFACCCVFQSVCCGGQPVCLLHQIISQCNIHKMVAHADVATSESYVPMSGMVNDLMVMDGGQYRCTFVGGLY